MPQTWEDGSPTLNQEYKLEKEAAYIKELSEKVVHDIRSISDVNRQNEIITGILKTFLNHRECEIKELEESIKDSTNRLTQLKEANNIFKTQSL